MKSRGVVTAPVATGQQLYGIMPRIALDAAKRQPLIDAPDDQSLPLCHCPRALGVTPAGEGYAVERLQHVQNPLETASATISRNVVADSGVFRQADTPYSCTLS